jgi:acyl-CoA thioesterase-1
MQRIPGRKMPKAHIWIYLALLAICAFRGGTAAADDRADRNCFVSDPAATPPCIVDRSTLDRSVINYGDDTRIRAVLKKAEAGQPIVISAIGGSVTQGAWASKPEYQYINRVFGWWQSTFPQSKMSLINAGIGSTDSAFAVQRVQKDLLQFSPDFVIVEFDVNDAWNSTSTVTYRDLVMRILEAPSHPAVMMLAVMDRPGNNAQEWHIPVQKEFNLPYVSEKNAIRPIELAGQVKPEDITFDVIHPNDLGHQILAILVATRLQQSLNAMRAGN